MTSMFYNDFGCKIQYVKFEMHFFELHIQGIYCNYLKIITKLAILFNRIHKTD